MLLDNLIRPYFFSRIDHLIIYPAPSFALARGLRLTYYFYLNPPDCQEIPIISKQEARPTLDLYRTLYIYITQNNLF